MVSDPPRKEVNVTRMIIYSFIPFLAIYAGWRIQKFRRLLAISILTFLGFYPLELYLPYGIGIVLSYIIPIFITIYFVNKYAKEYNEKVKNEEFSY